MTTGGIYLISHTSGAFYVGATHDFRRRWNQHRNAIRTGKGSRCRRLMAFARSAGRRPDEFSFTQIIVCAPEHLSLYETRALDAMGAQPACLNLRESRYGHHAESRAKIAAATSRSMADPIRRAKIGVIRRGAKHSPEAIERMRTAKRGPNNPNFGKRPSAKTRAKRSASMRAAQHPVHEKGHSLESREKMAASQRVAVACRVRGQHGRFV